MVISSNAPSYARSSRQTRAELPQSAGDRVTLSTEEKNEVDTGDKIMMVGVESVVTMLPAFGAGVGYILSKDAESKWAKAALLGSAALNGAGTLTLATGLFTGNSTAINAGLGMLCGAGVGVAASAWNTF